MLTMQCLINSSLQNFYSRHKLLLPFFSKISLTSRIHQFPFLCVQKNLARTSLFRQNSCLFSLSSQAAAHSQTIDGHQVKISALQMKKRILDFYSAGDKKSSQKPVMFYLMLSMVLSLIVLTVIAEIRYAMNPEMQNRFRPKAATIQDSESSEKKSITTKEQESNDDEEEEKKPKKKRMGFNARKTIEYENRIRSYSTPDKIFRYFATLRVYIGSGGLGVGASGGLLPGEGAQPTNSTSSTSTFSGTLKESDKAEVVHHYAGGAHDTARSEGENFEVFMTPIDFIRAVTPNSMQPRGVGLDQFRTFDPRRDELKMNLKPDSIFYSFGDIPLISFSDFVFLLTLLSVPERQFEIAFRMFDRNGNGELDLDEFDEIRHAIIRSTSIGKRHRDNLATGNALTSHSGLTKFFFGRRERKITLPVFLDFLHRLKLELLEIEFKQKEPNEEGRISEVNFGEILIGYADFTTAKIFRMLRRVDKKFPEDSSDSKGISFDEFSNVCTLLGSIQEMDRALTFYELAGLQLDQSTFKHVVKTVVGVELTDHVVDVLFTLFDEDGDGFLARDEFITVMRERQQHGLNRPKDMGFTRALNAFKTCTAQSAVQLLRAALPDSAEHVEHNK